MAKRFGHYLIGKVLDVGCDKAVLKKLLQDIHYTGVDIAGAPDIRLNLENIENLPFGDDIFDCIVCSDVLEHLDNLHHIFSEVIRVAKRYIIISLPNNWVNARKPIRKGKGSIGHYGLPIKPPQDRHKWFFNLSEATNFVKAQVNEYPISIIEILVTEKPRIFPIRIFRRLLYPIEEHYLNRYAHTLWVIFEKR
jgi:SAM-dependent methyltransferase